MKIGIVTQASPHGTTATVSDHPAVRGTSGGPIADCVAQDRPGDALVVRLGEGLGGQEAQVAIDGPAVLSGTLPRTAVRLINEWVGLHRDELLANWERAQSLQPLLPIEPLRSLDADEPTCTSP